MKRFQDEICPKCGIDLTVVHPERIREDNYSVCPNCGRPLPIIDVKPELSEPRAKGHRGVSKAEPVVESELLAEEAPSEEPEPEE